MTAPSTRFSVTVIIPLHNAAAYLEKTLAAVSAQSCPPTGVILVNDHSTDETLAIAERWAQDSVCPVQIVNTPEHYHIARSRNLGLEKAQTEWVLWMDHDDWIAPSLLESYWHTLQQAAPSPPVGVVYSQCTVVDEQDQVLYTLPSFGQLPPEDVFAYTLFTPLIRTCTGCLIRTQAMRELGGFRPEHTGSDDWDLYQRLAASGQWQFLSVDAPLVFYRRHQQNASASRAYVASHQARLLGQFTDDTLIQHLTPLAQSAPEAACLEMLQVMQRLQRWPVCEAIRCALAQRALPPSTSLRFYEGVYLAAQGQLAAAQAVFEQILTSEPTHLGAMLNAIIVRYQQGQHDLAQKQLAALAAWAPFFRDATSQLGALQSSGSLELTWTEPLTAMRLYQQQTPPPPLPHDLRLPDVATR